MKKVKLIALLIVGINVTSCWYGGGNGSSESDPFYTFTSQEKSLIIAYEYVAGDVIRYRNQFGEELYFQVVSVEDGMEEYINDFGGTFWGTSSIPAYREQHEIQRIRMEIVGNTNEEEYSGLNYVFSKRSDEFNGGINFPMWNQPEKRSISETRTNLDIVGIGSYHGRISLEINGHLFEKVFIIDSFSTQSLHDPDFGMLSQNVSKIYYDDRFGIVQFEDIDGKVWKVLYPN